MNRYHIMGLLFIGVLIVFWVLMATEVQWVRFAIAVLFCTTVPGSGWALRMRFKDVGDTLALSVMLSLSCTVLVATALAVGQVFNIFLGLGVLVLITIGGYIAALRGIPSETWSGTDR